ncbi:MAG: DAK2 domain-containing protein, partial [Propionicimonas sp.]|nr:DAK2 domain-containing protein [Propionicimonas sp.]
MSDTLSTAWALAWIRGAQAVIAENRMLLIELDREIGDADHGANMDKGFTAVVAKLEGGADSVQDVLKVVAQTLMSTVGGPAGPLY